MKKVLIILVLIFWGYTNSLAVQIKGVVYGVEPDGTKNKLPRATIQINNSQIGTFSNSNGEFSLTTEKASYPVDLIVTYVGYKPDTIIINSDQLNLEILLYSEFETNPINVYGEQPGNILSKSDIAKTEVITSAGLKKAACCNLSESFMTNPSVDVEYQDAVTGAKQIQLLGLHGSYVQLLSEKIPDMRGLATPFGLTYIPGSWIESIQISKGSSSVIDGYESITGQINVEYKKPILTEPYFFNLYASDKQKFEANFNSAIELNDKISTIIFAHGNYLQKEIDHNGDKFLDHPLQKQLNLMNRWNIENDNFESKTGFHIILEDRKAGQIGFFPNKNPALYGVDIQTQRYSFYTKNGFIFSEEPYSSLGTILAGNYHKVNSFYGQNSFSGTQKSFYSNLIYDTELFGQLNKLTFGFSYKYDEYHETFKDTIYPRKESVPGIFTELKYELLPNLVTIAGARADFHNLYGNFFTPRLHIKYKVSEEFSLRLSIGKGYKVPNIFAENSALLASSREFIFQETILPERAWNYGTNFTYDFKIADIHFTLNGEYYRTDFENQLIVDLDTDPNSVFFYNLKGKSYSNSFQIDLTFSPFQKFEVIVAYRMHDVKYTIHNQLVQKPLINKHKGFCNLAYKLGENNWAFDLTFEYSGGGRLPNTSKNPTQYQLPENFPAFLIINSQITKYFGDLEIYVGAENLTNFKQTNPILAYDQPFSKYFDSSMIWGPILGRNLYAGIRMKIW